MSTLNSFVLFNKTEIVKAIQDDRLFLLQLFRELIADSTPEPKYLQLVALLKELCVFSLVLENVDRAAFYLELDKYDFMTAVEGMLVSGGGREEERGGGMDGEGRGMGGGGGGGGMDGEGGWGEGGGLRESSSGMEMRGV